MGCVTVCGVSVALSEEVQVRAHGVGEVGSFLENLLAGVVTCGFVMV